MQKILYAVSDDLYVQLSHQFRRHDHVSNHSQSLAQQAHIRTREKEGVISDPLQECGGAARNPTFANVPNTMDDQSAIAHVLSPCIIFH